MVCRNAFRRYSGASKSEVIISMLNEQRRNEFKKDIQKVIKNHPELNKLRQDLAKKQKEMHDAEKKFNELCNKLKVQYNKYYKDDDAQAWGINYNACWLTDEEQKMLQLANNHSQLGNRTAAKKIFDKIIEDNKLIELM